AVIPLRLPEAAYTDPARIAATYATLLDRFRQLPGVTDAAEVTSAPFAGPNAGTVFFEERRPLAPGEQAPDADYRIITPGYLRTLGIRVVRGRDFSAADRAGAPVTMLISESMARHYWP